MDHESTHPHSHMGYVSSYAQTWPVDPVVCLEARAEKTSVFMMQMPAPPEILQAVRLSKELKCRGGVKQNPTLDSQDDPVNALRDSDIQVRIERSVVLDIKPENGDPVERDVYASPNSV